MAKTMIASQMTDGQIENMTDKFRAALRKHRSDIGSDVVQQVLGIENLGMEFFAVVRKHAERFSDMFVRHVKPDRNRTPQRALDATGRGQYTDKKVVAGMPKGEGEAEVHFFKLDRWISDDDLEKEYDARGLKPADPYSLAAVNEADPAFADERPNCTHWKDKDGKWCYAAFNHWFDERCVGVRRSGDGWYGHWFFAGVRK